MRELKIGDRVRFKVDHALCANVLEGMTATIITVPQGDKPRVFDVATEQPYSRNGDTDPAGSIWVMDEEHVELVEDERPAGTTLVTQLKVKRLHPDAVLPSYAKPGDAGLDLTAIDDGKTEVKTGDPMPGYNGYGNRTYRTTRFLSYRTGIAVEIPAGHVGLIFPRSSVSNTSLALSNAVGVIDSGYRGEIGFRFRVLDEYPIVYKKGDKIGQLIILPIPAVQIEEVETLTETERGDGGFGHTGN